MSRKHGIRERVRGLFTFSRAQRRGVLWLLPLLVVVGALIALANRPRFEKSFLQQVEQQTQVPQRDTAIAPAAAELFRFDPNTVTLQELCRLGFTQRTAAGIIKYRTKGKRFEIPEDFATCYGVTLEQYTRLEPYIIIGEQFRAAPRQNLHRQAPPSEEELQRPAPLSDFDPNALDSAGFVGLGFSPAQAAAILRYRTSLGGFGSAEDFGRSYVVSPEMFSRLQPHIKITPREPETKLQPVELNSADSARLRSVRGIGEVLVVRIMDYRRRLGGFARVDQLTEIPGMTEENYTRICQQISVDSCAIQKIDINFATPQTVVDALGNHPYITAVGLRKLLKNRQLKGGWRSIGDMVEQNIVTEQQAERLAPYLIFNAE